MKSLYSLIMAAFIIMGLYYCAHAEDTIRITNGEWPPYLSEQLSHYGLGSRIVTEAFASEGIKTVYGFFPWKRSLVIAKEGKDWDGSALWFRTPEREQDFYISEPVVESKYVFFHLKEKSFDWNTIDDLKNMNIGGTLEYDYGTEFQKAEKEGKIKVERIPTDENNLKKLLAGRTDVFPQDLEVGLAMIKKILPPEEAEKITYNSKPLKADPLCLLLTKQNPKNKELIEAFNKGLKKLKDSGKIEQFTQEARSGK